MSHDPSIWYFLTMIVVALAAVIQAVALCFVAFGIFKMRKRMQSLAEKIELQVMPTVAQVRSLVEETSPKLRQVTEHLLETSKIVRNQAQRINDTVGGVVDRTQAQIDRVDHMTSSVVDGLARVSHALEGALGFSSKQIFGISSGLRAGFRKLTGRNNSKNPYSSR